MKRTRFLLPALVLVLVLSFICSCSNDEVSNGEKIKFTLTVTHSDSSVKEFEIETDQTNLRKALDEQHLISGDESEYGLFITTVDGELAIYSEDEGWWCLSKDGIVLTSSIDNCEVSDGDSYELTYKKGY